jgi:hypothetical protein
MGHKKKHSPQLLGCLNQFIAAEFELTDRTRISPALSVIKGLYGINNYQRRFVIMEQGNYLLQP